MRTYFQTLTMENWRQYKGQKELPLSPNLSEGQNVSVIEGPNGGGKSNCVDAINLVINGEISDPIGDIDEEPLVNKEVMRQADNGTTVTSHIELQFKHRNTRHRLTREFESTKLGKGAFENSISSELMVQRYDGREWEEVDNPTEYINRILPPTIQKYYFFDGERLDEFFKAGYQDRVQTAVKTISQVDPLLTRAKDHLDSLIDERERDAAKKGGDVDQAKQVKSKKKATKEKLEANLERLEQDLRIVEHHLEAVEERLGAAATDEVQSLLEKKATLKATRREKRQQLQEQRENQRTALVEAGSVVFADQALQTAINQLEAAGVGGQLPPEIQRSYIEKRLEMGECMCGCNLAKHPDRKQQLEALKEEVPDVDEQSIRAFYEFPDLRESRDELRNELLDVRSTYTTLKQAIAKKEKKLTDITSRLDRKDLPDDIELRRAQQDTLGDIRDQLITAKARTEDQLEEARHELQAADDRLERELQKDDRQERIRTEVAFYKENRAQLETIKEALLDDIRARVETNLESHLNELIWKDEYWEVTLTSDYDISLMVGDEPKKMEWLSPGEKNVFVLAFIAALTEISGFSAPVVIDTPLARISGDPREHIAEHLPDYLQNHQLTFFFTEEEYTDTVATTLAPRVANEWELNYESDVTTIN